MWLPLHLLSQVLPLPLPLAVAPPASPTVLIPSPISLVLFHTFVTSSTQVSYPGNVSSSLASGSNQSGNITSGIKTASQTSSNSGSSSFSAQPSAASTGSKASIFLTALSVVAVFFFLS
ncbi:hypothetical protein SPOG_02655 [Schizosaccharomyces cryophilus OY26]|uniref:Uncharacterized protein n=1 Tax=Schizosaccharomyces cryophilus (strain OY26 / ATCC MYA-4695 / CBS 11777 / NBRC 106824 / NRRL Y48691) TaxID=653667 RepID=S9VZ51_SCHCR|nr:uncharacterized protein SPOG_02655 [Schizosaccharomyces cryophilus OY26]EPY51484.1 hypothetical protein SPOG_02655 [Schizosaccharomyces cryophilus OY26]